MIRNIELVCPAGSSSALKAAVDNGADAVYLGFRDGTNARNFSGLNFSPEEISSVLDYARSRGARVFVAINTYPAPEQWRHWCRAVDTAVAVGVDAIIVADVGLMRYCSMRHPQQRLHLSVQGSATNAEAIAFYVNEFKVSRVVLPRVLSVAQVEAVIRRVGAEVEVFGFGSLCVMAEGRCTLSAYVTGESPNMGGVCSPAKSISWEETPKGRSVRLNDVLVDVYRPGESAGYPQLCKGRFEVEESAAVPSDDRRSYYAFEEPTSLSILNILPQLIRSGVAAIKIEGRQRGPAYVAQVTRILREALNACIADPDRYVPHSEWITALNELAEGTCHTLGAYHRAWQ